MLFGAMLLPSNFCVPFPSQEEDEDEAVWDPIKGDGDLHSTMATDSEEDSAEDTLTDDTQAGSSSWLSRLWRKLLGAKPDPTGAARGCVMCWLLLAHVQLPRCAIGDNPLRRGKRFGVHWNSQLVPFRSRGA